MRKFLIIIATIVLLISCKLSGPHINFRSEKKQIKKIEKKVEKEIKKKFEKKKKSSH